MTGRPYVLMSAAMSVDGYIDDCSPRRLMLSDAADADRVDALRASCDAILVGAATLRRDNPRLMLASRRRRADRLAAGLPSGPAKVTLTRTGNLDPAARFFTDGDVPRLVYAAGPAAAAARRALGPRATIIALPGSARPGPSPAGDQTAEAPVDGAILTAMLTDLAARGVARLMVEGGSRIQAGFLAAGLVDELALAIAPLFVADPAAPRFAGGAWSRAPRQYPGDGRDPGAGEDHGAGQRPGAGEANPIRLAEARPVGGLVLLRYLLAPRPG